VAIAGVISTLVLADTSPFEKGMDKAGAAAGRLRAVTQQQSAGITSAFSAMGNLSGLGGMFGGITDKAASVFGAVKSVIGGFMGEMASLNATTAQHAAGVSASLAGMGKVASGGGGISGLFGLLATGAGAAIGVTLAAAAAGIGFGIALHTMASHGAEAITSINRLSKEVGISVEALSGLGTLAGGNAEGFGHAVLHMQRSIEEGSSAAGQALARMGLDLGALRDQSPLQQLEAIYGAWGRINSQGERAQAIRGLFGRGGSDMLDSLSRGTAGLEMARQRARDFGLEFTQEQADTVKRANREWAGFGQAMKGIGIQAASLFAPLWESVGRVGSTIGKTLVSAFKEAMPFLSAVGGLIGDIFGALANTSFLGPFIAVFKDAGGSIGDAFKAVMPWLTIIVETISAMVRIVGDVAGAIWSGIWTAIKAVGSAIVEAFSGTGISEWFASFNVGWANIKNFALGTMASIVVASKRFADVWSNAIDAAKIKFIEFKQLISGGFLGDQSQIDRLRAGMARTNTSIGSEVRALMRQWEVALAGGIQVAAAAQAAPARTSDRPDQRAITGHDAALQNSERAYSILNSQQPTIEQIARSQLESNRRIQAAVEAQLALERRRPGIRRIGR
jgi:hypothetical protein